MCYFGTVLRSSPVVVIHLYWGRICISFFYGIEVFFMWKLCHCECNFKYLLCVKEGSFILLLLFWNFRTFQHGIGTSPGSLKVKEAEGKEFFIAAASPAVWRLSQKEFKGFLYTVYCVTVAEQWAILIHSQVFLNHS